jgi:hypothetical protein
VADETKVGKVKRLLIERVTSILETGVMDHTDEGEPIVRAGSDKDLRLALDVVKTFHAEVGETTEKTATQLSGVLAKFREREKPHAN